MFCSPVRPLDLDPTQLPRGKRKKQTEKKKEKKKKSRDSSVVRAPDS